MLTSYVSRRLRTSRTSNLEPGVHDEPAIMTSKTASRDDTDSTKTRFQVPALFEFSKLDILQLQQSHREVFTPEYGQDQAL
jgi:hypothetical protein